MQLFSWGKNIEQWLKNNKINYECQKKFADLKDNLPLSYDFYLPDYNLLVEYQGRQHYEAVECFGGEEYLTIQKKHDRMKQDYAKEHNVELLEIKWTEFDQINTILTERITECRTIK